GILAAEPAKRVMRHTGDEGVGAGKIDAARKAKRSRDRGGASRFDSTGRTGAVQDGTTTESLVHVKVLRRGRGLSGPGVAAINAVTASLMNRRCRASDCGERG